MGDNSQPNQLYSLYSLSEDLASLKHQEIRWVLRPMCKLMFISLEITAVYIAVFELFDLWFEFFWIQIKSTKIKLIITMKSMCDFVRRSSIFCELAKNQKNNRCN